jgi:hypothetical protein
MLPLFWTEVEIVYEGREADRSTVPPFVVPFGVLILVFEEDQY